MLRLFLLLRQDNHNNKKGYNEGYERKKCFKRKTNRFSAFRGVQEHGQLGLFSASFKPEIPLKDGYVIVDFGSVLLSNAFGNPNYVAALLFLQFKV